MTQPSVLDLSNGEPKLIPPLISHFPASACGNASKHCRFGYDSMQLASEGATLILNIAQFISEADIRVQFDV
jgi:hypothetical protein